MIPHKLQFSLEISFYYDSRYVTFSQYIPINFMIFTLNSSQKKYPLTIDIYNCFCAIHHWIVGNEKKIYWPESAHFLSNTVSHRCYMKTYAWASNVCVSEKDYKSIQIYCFFNWHLNFFSYFIDNSSIEYIVKKCFREQR